MSLIKLYSELRDVKYEKSVHLRINNTLHIWHKEDKL